MTARYAYDPFGKRRYTNGNYDAAGNVVADWSSTSNAGTKNGFSGEEQLDDVGVVHMNGRLFDPMLGLFMQPNSSINNAANLQSFNRYSYCESNPLTCTDPTGLSAVRPFVSASALRLTMRNGAMVQGSVYIYTASSGLAFAGGARPMGVLYCAGGQSCASLVLMTQVNQVPLTAAQSDAILAKLSQYYTMLNSGGYQAAQDAAYQGQMQLENLYINGLMAYGMGLTAKQNALQEQVAKQAAALKALLRPQVEQYFNQQNGPHSAEGFLAWMNDPGGSDGLSRVNVGGQAFSGQADPGTQVVATLMGFNVGYASPDAAALAALKEANPLSIAANLEYGGLIYKNPYGGYDYTTPIQGTDKGVNPFKAALPEDAVEVGAYHTHGDYSIVDSNGTTVRTRDPARDAKVFNSNDFSSITGGRGDIQVLDTRAATRPEYRGYLGTPSGVFKVYNPASGVVSVLSGE